MEENSTSKRKDDFPYDPGKFSVWSFTPLSSEFNLLGNFRELPF